MPSDTELLEHLYDRFNARDMEAVLVTMHLVARVIQTEGTVSSA
jgi:hypothetical protein